MKTKGANVYLSAQELDALHEAGSFLSGLLEASPGDVPELIAAKAGLHSIIDKVAKARNAEAKRSVVKKALGSIRNT